MYTYRKFFDPAIAEPAAAPIATVEQPMNIAAMMAKQGVKNETDQMVAIPIEIEKKEEPTPAKEVAPVATTTVPSPTAEPAKPESQTPVVEPAIVPEPQKVVEQPKVQSWQEVLKSQQPDAVFKELGYDDKTVKLFNELKQFDPKVAELIQAYKEGRHVEYLRELSTDYSKMPAEEVMRHQLRKDYPSATEAQLNVLYKSKVINAFGLNSEEEGIAEEGRLLLEAEADRHRTELTKNQEKYLLPPAPEPQPIVEDNTEQLRKERDEQVYKTRVSDHSYTKELVANKKISIGEGENKVTIPIEPQDLLDFWFEPKVFGEKLFDIQNVDGRIDMIPKVQLQMEAAAFILNRDKFLEEYAKHFKSLGGEKAIEPIVNAKMPDKNTATVVTLTGDSPAAQLAKAGKVNYGGN